MAKLQDGKRKDCPGFILPLLCPFLKYFEKSQQIIGGDDDYISKEVRFFLHLSMKIDLHCNHLKICNAGLYRLLKRSNIEDMSSSREIFLTMADTYWRNCFRIKKYEAENRKFDRDIKNCPIKQFYHQVDFKASCKEIKT